MKKFEVTYTVKHQFALPDSATDEEYDAAKEIMLADVQKEAVGDIKVELIDAPDEIKQKYIINRECD